MNDLNFSELQSLLEQLKTLKADSAEKPGMLTTGICRYADLLLWYHMLDWPKHSGDLAFPIKLKSWESDAESQYYRVFHYQAPTKLAAQYIELRKELLDFLINKTEKEISERLSRRKIK